MDMTTKTGLALLFVVGCSPVASSSPSTDVIASEPVPSEGPAPPDTGAGSSACPVPSPPTCPAMDAGALPVCPDPLDAGSAAPALSYPLYPAPWGAPPEAIVVNDGDSISVGYDVPPGGSYGAITSLRLGTGVRFVPTGQSGAHMDSQDETFDLRVRPHLLDAGAIPAVVMTNAGTNDLAATEDAGGVWEHQVHYCEQVHDAGAKCVIVNVLPRAQEAVPGVRAELHAIQAAHWPEAADGFVDTWGDAKLMDAGSSTWFVDGLHPSPNGQLEMENHVEPVVLGVLKDAGLHAP